MQDFSFNEIIELVNPPFVRLCVPNGGTVVDKMVS